MQAAVALGGSAVVAGSRRMTHRELARTRGATGVVDLSDVDGLSGRILDDVADAWSRAGATPDGRLVVLP